jgi:hypothetical protein
MSAALALIGGIPVEALVIEWDGSEVPRELRELPPGRYLLEPLDDLLVLTPEEDAGIREAMDDLDAGNGIPLEDVLAELRAGLRPE